MTAPAALVPYRVLDLTGAAGALGGRLLAGLGADVIKVERPGGDPARAQGPFLGGAPDPGRSLPWLYANAGKRGITLDLEQPEGRDLLCGLVATSHFVFESFPPGYLESLDLGWEQFRAVNPALVLVRISPYGQTGPYRAYQATDLTLWAMGGQLMLDGDEGRPPVRVTAPQADLLSGAHAAAGAMTAHHHRMRTGQGQVVDISMRECITWTLMIAAQVWDISRINPPRGGGVRLSRRPDGSTITTRTIWPCKDGFVLWALGVGGQAGAVASTRALVAWMAGEGAAADLQEVDWASMTLAAIDQEAYDRYTAPFASFFAAHEKRELFEGAIAREIQLAPVNDIPDIAASPQLAARDYWVDVPHPALDATLRFPGAPVKLSATPFRPPHPAPRPGEHNAEIYGDLLGLSEPEIAGLAARGVL